MNIQIKQILMPKPQLSDKNRAKKFKILAKNNIFTSKNLKLISTCDSDILKLYYYANYKNQT